MSEGTHGGAQSRRFAVRYTGLFVLKLRSTLLSAQRRPCAPHVTVGTATPRQDHSRSLSYHSRAGVYSSLPGKVSLRDCGDVLCLAESLFALRNPGNILP